MTAPEHDEWKVLLCGMALGVMLWSGLQSCVGDYTGKAGTTCYANHTCNAGLACMTYPENDTGVCVAPGTVRQTTEPTVDGGTEAH